MMRYWIVFVLYPMSAYGCGQCTKVLKSFLTRPQIAAVGLPLPEMRRTSFVDALKAINRMERLEATVGREAPEYARQAYEAIRQTLEGLPESIGEGSPDAKALEYAARLYGEVFATRELAEAERDRGQLEPLFRRLAVKTSRGTETGGDVLTRHPAYAGNEQAGRNQRKIVESGSEALRAAVRQRLHRLLPLRSDVAVPAGTRARTEINRLAGEDAALSGKLVKGEIPLGDHSLYRASELAHELALLPGVNHHTVALDFAYRRTIKALADKKVTLKNFTETEKGEVDTFLSALGLNRASLDGGTPLANRIKFFLLSLDEQKPGSFSELAVKELSDVISAQVSAEDILRLPFLFRKWRLEVVRSKDSPDGLSRGGNGKGVDSYVWLDPSGRIRIVYTQLGGNEKEFEVVKLMQDKDGNVYLDPKQSFSVVKDSGKKKSSEEAARQCLLCHMATPGGAFLTTARSAFVRRHGLVPSAIYNAVKGGLKEYRFSDYDTFDADVERGGNFAGFRPVFNAETLRKVGVLNRTTELDSLPLPNVK